MTMTAKQAKFRVEYYGYISRGEDIPDIQARYNDCTEWCGVSRVTRLQNIEYRWKPKPIKQGFIIPDDTVIGLSGNRVLIVCENHSKAIELYESITESIRDKESEEKT